MMKINDDDRRTLDFVEGELSQLEAHQVAHQLVRDPVARSEADDLRAIVLAARAASTATPAGLLEQAIGDWEREKVARSSPIGSSRRRRGAIVFAVAAALVAAIWLGADASVAQALGAAVKSVRVLLFNDGGRVVEDLTAQGTLNASGDTLLIDMALGHNDTDQSQEDVGTVITMGGEGGTVTLQASADDTLRIETNSDHSGPGSHVIRVWKGEDVLGSDAEGQAGGAGKAAGDSAGTMSWGEVKQKAQ